MREVSIKQLFLLLIEILISHKLKQFKERIKAVQYAQLIAVKSPKTVL